ncbi:hypothetical protein K438DRAFT_1753594 [Mycena galopus ATCC 62051]|nr:hypothetical protein K438DRAFT_1753594 [Mycena galopus ATCC 62051]
MCLRTPSAIKMISPVPANIEEPNGQHFLAGTDQGLKRVNQQCSVIVETNLTTRTKEGMYASHIVRNEHELKLKRKRLRTEMCDSQYGKKFLATDKHLRIRWYLNWSSYHVTIKWNRDQVSDERNAAGEGRGRGRKAKGAAMYYWAIRGRMFGSPIARLLLEMRGVGGERRYAGHSHKNGGQENQSAGA